MSSISKINSLSPPSSPISSQPRQVKKLSWCDSIQLFILTLLCMARCLPKRWEVTFASLIDREAALDKLQAGKKLAKDAVSAVKRVSVMIMIVESDEVEEVPSLSPTEEDAYKQAGLLRDTEVREERTPTLLHEESQTPNARMAALRRTGGFHRPKIRIIPPQGNLLVASEETLAPSHRRRDPPINLDFNLPEKEEAAIVLASEWRIENARKEAYSIARKNGQSDVQASLQAEMTEIARREKEGPIRQAELKKARQKHYAKKVKEYLDVIYGIIEVLGRVRPELLKTAFTKEVADRFIQVSEQQAEELFDALREVDRNGGSLWKPQDKIPLDIFEKLGF